MNKIICFLLAALITAGCSTPYDGQFSKLIAEERFGTAPKTLQEQAMRLASQAYSSIEYQDKFVYSYYSGYESGLQSIHGEVIVGDESGPNNQGLQAGRAAAIVDLKASTPKVTLKDYGYTEIETKGKLKFEFENQEFLPDGSGARWWVVYNPDVVKRYDEVLGEQKQFRWRSLYVFAHFRGYLAPDIGIDVGHFNQYDREFVVRRIIEMKRFEERPNQQLQRTSTAPLN